MRLTVWARWARPLALRCWRSLPHAGALPREVEGGARAPPLRATAAIGLCASAQTLSDHRAPSEAARQWLRAIGGLPGTRPPIVHAWIGVYSCQGA